MKEYRKYLLYFWLCTAILVLGRIYYSPNGYISPDSGNYLRLARNLAEGKGMYVYHPCAENQQEYFAKWPLGYPALTALVMIVSPLKVFWASKVCNLLLLLGSILILHRLFREKILYVLPVIFIDSYINIICSSWSENLFIFGILLSILALKNLNRKADIASGALILLSSQIIFLSRYAGIVIFLLFGACGLIFLFLKQKKQFRVLLISSVVSILLCTAYLLINAKLNGNPTGLDHGQPLAPFSSLLRRTFLALGFEMAPIELLHGPGFWLLTLPLTLFSCALTLLYLYRRKFLLSFKNLHFNLNDTLILSGFFWWISIIVFSFFIHFDPLGYRLLGPGTILIFAGLAAEFLPMLKWQKELKITLLVFPLLFTVINLLRIDKTENFPEAEQNRIAKYSALPEGSLVLFGDSHLHYLFERIRPLKPNMDLDRILKRYENCGVKAIYLERMPGCSGVDKALPQLYEQCNQIKGTEYFIRLR